jgi:beta-glucanase (GH16 family)
MRNDLRFCDKGFVAMMFFLTTLAFGSACGAQDRSDASVSPLTQRQGWKLVWHDEFDGDSLDPAGWTYDIGGWGWGNNELELYTQRRENVRVEGGMLVIEARAEERENRRYTSGRIKTQGLHSWKYGRIEARLLIPAGQGIWPAFWMLGEDIVRVPWPGCGEIDIMESIGRQPEIIHGTAHGPGYSGSGGPGKSFAYPSGESFAEGFHLYAVEWDADRIQWFVDDALYFTLTAGELAAKKKKWIFDHPFFILLNVAVGGTWPGSPNDTTSFPQRMLVDYVRVWERAP